MFNSELLAIALAFAVAMLIVVGVYSFFQDFWGKSRRQIRRRVSVEAASREVNTSQEIFRDLTDAARQLSAEDPSNTTSWREKFRRVVAQSGLPISAERLLLRSLLFGVLAAFFALLITWSSLACLLAAVTAALLPIVHMLSRRHARLEKLTSQLADAFEMMSRVLRAGQSTAHALRLVSEEMPDPIASEFGTCYEQQNLGIAPALSFRELARRTGLFEIKMFVVAMLVHRESGGNLAELLERLAGVIRERYRLRGTIRTLTAEGRFQAAILLALPLFIFLAVMLLQPGYMTVLLSYPWLFVVAGTSELIGALWIRKIVNLEL